MIVLSQASWTIEDFTLQLEAYVMSGIKGVACLSPAGAATQFSNGFFIGVVENSKAQTLDLKKRVATVIIEKLRWPLAQFRNPSTAATRIDLEVLINSWQSGTTRFQKLTKDEKCAWKEEHFSSRVAMMSSPPPSASIPTASLPTPDTTLHISSAFTQPPGPVSPIPMPTEMLVAEIIRQDPTLQAIDPALIMAGVTQGFHHSAAAGSNSATPRPPSAAAGSAESLDHPTLAPPISRKKRGRGAFEIVTLESFNTRAAKVPQNKRAKKTKHVTGGENIPPAKGTSQPLSTHHRIDQTFPVLGNHSFPGALGMHVQRLRFYGPFQLKGAETQYHNCAWTLRSTNSHFCPHVLVVAWIVLASGCVDVFLPTFTIKHDSVRLAHMHSILPGHVFHAGWSPQSEFTRWYHIPESWAPMLSAPDSSFTGHVLLVRFSRKCRNLLLYT
ncbi:hypothetical protein BJ322DRAFT_1020300 [Thelephora terrestris]|uniref:Uncharacterized protein n=1 Tax=Thelephora terrestris TaxID=56493 RepID=A0A9P6L735_9AGAM|nr:hypothetical protein BJ322DRAFT_1020300 [Thelephora terrestris]